MFVTTPRLILIPWEVEGITIDWGLQQTLNTENPWLNVIITHSKFIASPFIC